MERKGGGKEGRKTRIEGILRARKARKENLRIRMAERKEGKKARK